MSSVLLLSEKKQKKIIEQYEFVRQSGLTNMFDMGTVHKIAVTGGMSALASATKDSEMYASILKNYEYLMLKVS